MKDIVIPGRLLGIFWTTASWSIAERTIQVTNQDKAILIEANSFLSKYYDAEYSVYEALEKEKHPDYDYEYHRMKIYNQDFINLLREKYKWRSRREEKRYYPTIDNEQQEVEFLQYYIADQGTLDKMNVSWGKGWIYRYRVYCSRDFIGRLNSRISIILGVNENKPQKHSQSNSMMTLYYQSRKDVNAILDFIQIKGSDQH